MRGSVDRALVEQLLEIESLSYREIARQAGCSDWSVRSIARDLARSGEAATRGSDEKPHEPAGLAAWLVFAGFVASIVGAIWFAGRQPPLDGPTL